MCLVGQAVFELAGQQNRSSQTKWRNEARIVPLDALPRIRPSIHLSIYSSSSPFIHQFLRLASWLHFSFLVAREREKERARERERERKGMSWELHGWASGRSARQIVWLLLLSLSQLPTGCTSPLARLDIQGHDAMMRNLPDARQEHSRDCYVGNPTKSLSLLSIWSGSSTTTMTYLD